MRLSEGIRVNKVHGIDQGRYGDNHSSKRVESVQDVVYNLGRFLGQAGKRDVTPFPHFVRLNRPIGDQAGKCGLNRAHFDGQNTA